MSIEENIRIRASAGKVFDYLMNVDNRKEYIPALDEVILLDPLPLKLGSRYIEVAEIAGRKLKTTYQIIEFKPNEKITAETIESIFPITAELSLNESYNSTELTINLDFTLKGIFKLGAGIVKGIVKKQAEDILEKIKENIENPKDSSRY